jgi:hypothetical protein
MMGGMVLMVVLWALAAAIVVALILWLFNRSRRE